MHDLVNDLKSQSVFTDDTPEMRKNLIGGFHQSAPKINPISNEMKRELEFFYKIMSVLNYPKDKQEQMMNEIGFGIEVIAMDRVLESMPEADKQRFGAFFEKKDDDTPDDPRLINDFREYIRANSDGKLVFECYMISVAAITDLYITEMMSEADENQKDEIDKILLEVQDNMRGADIEGLEKLAEKFANEDNG